MVLIVTRDADLAQRIGAAISDEKRYLVGGVETPTALRHEVYATQPDVLLIDARFGGNLYRVMESIPKLVRQTTSNPAVILLTPWESKSVEKEAAKAGCYDVINVDGSALKRRVAKVVAAAFAARAADGDASRPSSKVTH